MTDFMASALEYAAHGWRVFPCKALGKAPLTSMGFREASVSEAIIKAWWTKWPDANVGLPVPEGMVVVDVDSGEGLEILRSQDLSLPSTVSSFTPRGRHFYYSMPEGVAASPRVGLLPSIDIRAAGSYVIAPPSVGSDGVVYEWDNDLTCDISEAPEWLVEMLRHEPMKKERVNPDEVLSGIRKGARDVQIFRYCCRLRSQGLGRKEAEVLACAAASACDPPMDKEIALRKVEQAWRYPGKEPEETTVKVWSFSELESAKLEKPDWIVEGLLPEGLSMLVSAPKAGKSNLIRRLILESSVGLPFLGMYPTFGHGAIHCDLEDAPYSSRSALQKINLGRELPSNCYTAYTWPRLDAGCLDHMARFIDDKPEIRLVIFDVLAMIRGSGENESGGVYVQEYRVMGELSRFASDNGICVLIAHHDSKNKARDIIGRAGGTRAMSGSVQTMLVLERNEDSTDGELYAVGKHIRRAHVPLRFDDSTLRWEVR